MPDEGRKFRSFFVKASDETGHVFALFGSAAGLNVTYDLEKIDPSNQQRAKRPAVSASGAVALDQWHIAVVESRGEEMVAAVDDLHVRLSGPVVAAPKHSVMLGVGVLACFLRSASGKRCRTPSGQRTRHRTSAGRRRGKGLRQAEGKRV